MVRHFDRLRKSEVLAVSTGSGCQMQACWYGNAVNSSLQTVEIRRQVHSIFPSFAAVPMVHLLESGEALKSALSTETGGEANYS